MARIRTAATKSGYAATAVVRPAASTDRFRCIAGLQEFRRGTALQREQTDVVDGEDEKAPRIERLDIAVRAMLHESYTCPGHS